jgi:uncharacterized membrane protein HdeD (DUF308 family)
MQDAMTNNWRVFLVRGVFGLIVGSIAFAMPGLALLWVLFAWTSYAQVDGITAVVLAGADPHSPRVRDSLLAIGAVGVIAGLLSLLWSSLSLNALLWIMALWAVARGLLQIVAAAELKGDTEGWWLMVASGAASVVFGAGVIALRWESPVAIAHLIGSYASTVGLLEVVLAFRNRQLAQASARTPRTRAAETA